MVHPLETYLQELSAIRASGAGVPETSGYGALATLLNAVGTTLKPKVCCVINLQNQGAGLPDGGLFTPEQFQRAADGEPLPGQLPGRGAIEVKSTAADLDQVVAADQVARYLQKYGQLLVTNYREFLLVTPGVNGQPTPGERYRLAESETAFWAAAAHPHKAEAEHGKRLTEYLQRVMRYPAPLTAPADLAWFLASYARDAHARVDARSDLPALDALRKAMENALGMAFQGEQGEHFFRSTLVQTLFYGVFAAWVLWHKENPERAEPFRLAPDAVLPQRTRHPGAFPAGCWPWQPEGRGSDRAVGLGRRDLEPSQPGGLFCQIRGCACHPILLRAVPASL